MKTSILIDRRLWEEFKSRIGGGGRLRALSRAVEEAIEEEVVDLVFAEELSKMLGACVESPLTVTPVRPLVPVDAGRVLRELRETRGL